MMPAGGRWVLIVDGATWRPQPTPDVFQDDMPDRAETHTLVTPMSMRVVLLPLLTSWELRPARSPSTREAKGGSPRAAASHAAGDPIPYSVLDP